MGIDLVRVAGWDGIAGLRAGFTGRAGGSSTVYGGGGLNLGKTREDEESVVLRNRALLVEELGGGVLRAVRQVHSDRVVVVRAGETLEGVEADGMVTDGPGVLLGVLAADCVPVLVADRRLRVVGAFHAGWRGTVAGIVARGVELMKATYGCREEDLVGAVGPSIGPCCYAVGDEVREQFREEVRVGDRVDLWAENRRQLVEGGLGRVTVVGECTCCTRVDGARRYWSHRADGGGTGRGMGVVGFV